VSAERERAERALQEWLSTSGVEHSAGARPGEYVVALPGEAKLSTTVSLLLSDRGLSASAFVVRRPDENHEAFYRWLLQRNIRLRKAGSNHERATTRGAPCPLARPAEPN